MARLTINLTDAQFEKIKTLAEQRSMTLSHCSTHLIDLGLRVEDASRQPKVSAEGALTSSPHIQQTNRQWQKLLTWALESRYLIRYLITRSSQESVEQRRCFYARGETKSFRSRN